MRELFRKLGQCLEAAEAVVLVSVIASSGSVPGGAGTRMLVTAGGRMCGTIGGGSVEYACEQQALEVLARKSSALSFFQLRRNEIRDLGMVCGGDVEVYFHYIGPKRTDIRRRTAEIEAAYRERRPAWLGMEITPGAAGSLQLQPDNVHMRAGKQSEAGQEWYWEKLDLPERVMIFGGGHVSQALVPALTAVNFDCIVLEDRPEFARPELFAGALQVRLIDNARVNEFVQVEAADYVIIMTRGHRDDQQIQAQILQTPARYIGVIGSRHKKAAVRANLRALGFAERDLDRVTTPIGLPIKARSPAEIAVSITAQLIYERNK